MATTDNNKQKLIDFSKALLGYGGGGITAAGQARLEAATREAAARKAAATSASSMTDDLHSKARSAYAEASDKLSPHIEGITDRASEIGEGALIAANSFGGKMLDAVKNTAETVVAMVDGMVPRAEDGGKEWKEIAPNIKSQIEGPAELAKDAITDPEVQAAVKKALALYGEALSVAIEATEPEMNAIIEQLVEVGDNALKKTTIGAINSLRDTLDVAVSVIPGGGLAIAAMEIGDLINVILFGSVIPWLQANLLLWKDVLPALEKMKAEAVNKYGPKLLEARQDVTAAIEKARSKAQGLQKLGAAAAKPSIGSAYAAATNPNARQLAIEGAKQSISGGGGKKRRKKAARTMRRLKKTLNRFANPKVHGTKKHRRRRGTRKNK